MNTTMETALQRAHMLVRDMFRPDYEPSADAELDAVVRVGISMYIQNNRKGQ